MKLKTIEWDGRKISKPGIYSGISIETYHDHRICDGPSISSSGLRTIFNQSPAHFYAKWSGNPDRVEEEPTRALVFGQAIHHLILGQRFFHKLFAIQPEEWPDENGVLTKWNGNRTVCRMWKAERHKEGRAIITVKEAEQMRGMATRLANHRLVQRGILNGHVERSMFWKDKETGIWLKSRPDNIPTDSGDFVDIKSTESTQWLDLTRTIAKYGYNMQAALVREGSQHLMKLDQITFTLIFIEKKAPHAHRIVTVKDNDLDLGHRQNHAALVTFAQCLRDNHWPAPGEDREEAEYIEMPDYLRTGIEDRLKYGL